MLFKSGDVRVLKRCDIVDLIPAGQYEFTVARGDVRRLGNERNFRLNGLPQSYRDNIYTQVKQKFEQIKSSPAFSLTHWFNRLL